MKSVSDDKALIAEVVSEMSTKKHRRGGRSVIDMMYSGCFDCWGSDAHWEHGDVVKHAREHHKKTGHHTWADGSVKVQWGEHE